MRVIAVLSAVFVGAAVGSPAIAAWPDRLICVEEFSTTMSARGQSEGRPHTYEYTLDQEAHAAVQRSEGESDEGLPLKLRVVERPDFDGGYIVLEDGTPGQSGMAGVKIVIQARDLRFVSSFFVEGSLIIGTFIRTTAGQCSVPSTGSEVESGE